MWYWYDHIKAYVGADNYNNLYYYIKLIIMDDSVVVCAIY